MLKRFSTGACALLLSFSSVSTPAYAARDVDLLAFALGYFDANDDESAIDFRAEIRFGKPIIADLKTWIGVEATSDGGLYGAGGLLYDWEFADECYFVPSWGVGLYSDGGGKDLGHTVQFRTQLEFQYEFADYSRISLAASHISNADLAHRNPGTEIVSVYYSIPF